ncbi:hypothetical protein DPMN_155097 [Dreissena polymorpha]|uniref:Uncharacterized protein n=1 Tax=Dreissena polymorpha TaxID=45954 RepID=A0A9D4FR68_DREPO|nr:hypothetical protein DPMN_155097 [Dreissena polymorpha]
MHRTAKSHTRSFPEPLPTQGVSVDKTFTDTGPRLSVNTGPVGVRQFKVTVGNAVDGIHVHVGTSVLLKRSFVF